MIPVTLSSLQSWTSPVMGINLNCWEAKMCHDWLRKGFNLVAYGCLSLLTGYLVIGIYKDYQEGKTDFLITKEPLKLADYPAILVEFNHFQDPYYTPTNMESIQYGKHFKIEGNYAEVR